MTDLDPKSNQKYVNKYTAQIIYLNTISLIANTCEEGDSRSTSTPQSCFKATLKSKLERHPIFVQHESYDS